MLIGGVRSHVDAGHRLQHWIGCCIITHWADCWRNAAYASGNRRVLWHVCWHELASCRTWRWACCSAGRSRRCVTGDSRRDEHAGAERLWRPPGCGGRPLCRSKHCGHALAGRIGTPLSAVPSSGGCHAKGARSVDCSDRGRVGCNATVGATSSTAPSCGWLSITIAVDALKASSPVTTALQSGGLCLSSWPRSEHRAWTFAHGSGRVRFCWYLRLHVRARQVALDARATRRRSLCWTRSGWAFGGGRGRWREAGSCRRHRGASHAIIPRRIGRHAGLESPIWAIRVHAC